LRVAALPRERARGDEPVLLELARELRRDAAALAELAEIELLVVGRERERSPAGALRRSRAVQLLTDHAQRQELVALHAQDRAQPLDVLLAEQAVAAARPPRREQALVLEVADLRDRDVRELVLEAAAHR